MPLGNNGLTVNPEFTRVDTNPRSGPGTAQVTGDYERFALRASYPLIRSRRQSLTLTGALELIVENQVAQAIVPLSRDRLRVIDLGATYNRALSSRLSLITDGQLALGLASLGARGQADVEATGIPLSRQGSRPDYRKINARVQLDELLGNGFNLTSVTRAQASFTGALPSSAQFSLDGSDGLSSFAQGTINVDSGLTERVELACARSFGGHGQLLLTPYVFGAAGYGHLADPTALELANMRSWAAGGGGRLLLSPPHSALSSFISAEVSHGHVNTLNGLSGDPTRVSATLSIRF